MKLNSQRCSAIAGAILILTGCATAPGQPYLGTQLRQTFASDDPCADNSRNIGVVGGAALGALLGNSLGNGRRDNKIIGATLGGLIGGFIGADMDRKRCELSKLAKQYDLEITFTKIESPNEGISPILSQSASGNASAAKVAAVVGNSVSVRDKDGVAGHFESGSDQLTPKAKEYFSAIAAQYAPDTVLAAHPDESQKAEIRGQLAQRRILLVGHTDDTGSSQLNVSLSERRARAVASYLKQKGVPEAHIFYQGAGETLPAADNRTEEGRASNRRVEIVEVADETGFKRYLETRKPQYAFYRTQPASPLAVEKTVISATAKSAVTSTAATPQPVNNQPKPAPQQIAKSTVAKMTPVINFGGTPYSFPLAKIDTGGLQSGKGLNLISRAQAADDSVVQVDCSYDRPRAVGSVKSLWDGSAYKTTDHLPQLYGKTWADDVNGNLVVINHLAVLRGSGMPANLPELKVYSQFKPGSNQKPEVSEEPAVNSYLVGKGVLYRMFARGDGGMKCMDILFGVDGASSAKAGKLIYGNDGDRYVADFKPQIQ